MTHGQQQVYRWCRDTPPDAVKRTLAAMRQQRRNDLPFLSARAAIVLFLDETYKPGI